MNHDLRLVLLAFVIIAFTPASAATSKPQNVPTSTAVASTQFARIARNAHGGPAALQLAVVTYAPASGRGDFTVDLVSAIHVADQAYYRGLNKRFRDYDALLYELIVPDDRGASQESEPGVNLISGMQNGIKNALGLTFQLDEVDYEAANFVHADLTSTELAESMAERGESLYVYFWRLVFASLEEYSRDPLGLKDWRLVSSLLSSEDDALKIAFAYELVNAPTTDILGGETGSAVIAARNEHAVGVLRDQIEAGSKRIGIFYGVAHMPDFERRLLKELSLEKVAIEWIDAWRFGSGSEDAADLAVTGH